MTPFHVPACCEDYTQRPEQMSAFPLSACSTRKLTIMFGMMAMDNPTHTLGHPRNWNHLLLASDLLTGLVVFAMRILYRCGFLPTGDLWYCTSWNTRRMPTELPTHLGWTWKWLRMILRRSGRRQMPIGGCSSRWATTRIAIRMLTGTIKADWIQLPVERYLTALPTLKQGVIAGVFKNKGAAPWAITRAEKLQLSVFLPNDLSLDDWYAGVYALPTVWPDVSTLGANNLRRVVGYDFHHLRKKYDVPSMWGNIHPQWRLLQQHLETKGTGWYPLSEREERLFTNRSNRPGDDMKDELRTDGDPIAWRMWSTAQNQLWQLRQPAPPLEFPGEQGMFTDMYAQVREEEQVISLQFTRSQQDVPKRRRKKRKQVDDGTTIV